MGKRWRNAAGERIRNDGGARIVDDTECCCDGGFNCEYCPDSPRTVQVTIAGVVDQVDEEDEVVYAYSVLNGTYVLPDFTVDSSCGSAPGHIWPYSEGNYFVSVYIRGAEFEGAHPEFETIIGNIFNATGITWKTRDHFGNAVASVCKTTVELPFDDAAFNNGGPYIPYTPTYPFDSSTATVTIG